MTATVLEKFFDILNDSAGISDSRMDRFLMKSPLEFLIVVATYLMIILKIGPAMMKDRKPFSLKKIIIGYNVIQIFVNAAIFHNVFLIRHKMSIFCTNPDTSNSVTNIAELRIHYSYLMLKYFDLIETVFYVLRKKGRQISFLHVYHHIGILLAAWVSGKYFPGGQALYVAYYNTAIHCLMYCYYLTASLSSDSGRYIWWKKYVTALQIVQHCLIFSSIFPSIVNPSCSYPKFWMSAFAVNVLVIIHLFVQFFRNTYLKKAKAT